ncbi:hypothetical protein [Achromobacter kerstersii]|uniref:hypothetical protein n=1 Tax=Achromobacter kerstersii TaxID=1353890 RepID=UPI003CFC9A2B
MSLTKGNVYHLVRNHHQSGRAIIALFTHAKRPAADLIMLDRLSFEAALAEGKIVPAPNPSGLPPHLDGLKDTDLVLLDTSRTAKKTPNAERVQQRLLAIAPLLEREQEILAAPSPESLISAYAKSVGKNSGRLRTWFLTYITFGRNAWALLPNFAQIGLWDRASNTTSKSKFGRPSPIRGKLSGIRPTPEAIELILASYAKRCALGKKLRKIYQHAMKQDFKAKTVYDQAGHMTFVGDNVPTYDQYRYQVHKHYGLATVQRTLYGEAKFRRRFAAHKGSFPEGVSSLYEATEADGYVCEDRPKGYIDGAVLQALHVVRSVDTASGMRLGIGFSFGGETSEAYNAMLFCAAISKVKFCSLFDIEIDSHEWPSAGLTPRHITDRGPGIKREPGAPAAPSDALAIRELTPSGMGQSKALVESAQRRRTKTEGPETYLTSDLTVYQMARREIRRLLAEIQGADVSGRMTPEMIRANVRPNPVGVWKFLDDRARNLAERCSFAAAVRRFLAPITVRLDRDGAYLRHQRYDSLELRQTNVLDRIGESGTKTVPGYYLPFCIRYLWLEVDGRLVEVGAVLKLRDDEEQLYRTFDDLLAEDRVLKNSRTLLLEHRDAAQVAQMRAFEAETGQRWETTKRRSTRAGPKASAASDNQDVKKISTGKTHA